MFTTSPMCGVLADGRPDFSIWNLGTVFSAWFCGEWKFLSWFFFFSSLQCRRKRFPVFWGNDRKWRRSCFSLIDLGTNWWPQVRPRCISANQVRDAVKLEEGTFGKVLAWVFQVLSLGLACAESPTLCLCSGVHLPGSLTVQYSHSAAQSYSLTGCVEPHPSSSWVLCALISVLLKSFS